MDERLGRFAETLVKPDEGLVGFDEWLARSDERLVRLEERLKTGRPDEAGAL